MPRAPSAWEGRVPRQDSRDEGPVGSMRYERQYRGDRASRRACLRLSKKEVSVDGKKHEGPVVFVGVDWATQEHRVCALTAAGEVLGEKAIRSDAEGLEGMCRWLLEISGGDPSQAWVGIEVPHGVVVETLLDQGFVVFAINPKQMDRFRDRFTVAGAKDDRRDALVIADSLRTDAQCYRRLKIDEPEVIELREWSRMTDELVDERRRLTNRMREQLRRYYPQMLSFDADLGSDWLLDVWEAAPTSEAARKIRPAAIRKILAAHRIRKWNATAVLDALRVRPVQIAPGTATAASAHFRLLLERLRVANRQLREAHCRLDALCDLLAQGSEPSGDQEGQKCGQRDVEILRSLPGVGRIVLATLLAEGSSPLEDRDYHALRALAGVAPVTRASGKRRVVVIRRACHPRLRNALYHWTRVAVQRDPISRVQYRRLRERGHSHGRSLRSVGDRLLAVACAMLRDGTTYDPARRCTAAHKRAA